MSTRSPPTAAKMAEWLAQSPFHRVLGLALERYEPNAQTLALRCSFHSELDRSATGGQYHGGVIASLIDIAGDFALIAALGHGVPTINFRVDYLRPAMQSDLIARATVRKAGKTIGVVDIEVQDEQLRLIALGRGCYGTQPG
jgi:uncharacterized protein (TIGR00369 family)